MFRSICIITMALFTVSFGLAVGFRASGGMQPIAPALQGLIDECASLPPPCWYGILPGSTSIESALAHLHQHPELNVLRDFQSGVVWRVIGVPDCDDVALYAFEDSVEIVLHCAHIRFGDLIPVLGEPSHIDYCLTNNQYAIWFERSQVEVLTRLVPDLDFYHLQGGIAYTPLVNHFFIWLRDPARRSADWQLKSRWHGFPPLWRMTQFTSGHFGLCGTGA
ncbi:MAG TPA: hypothetical protein PLQ56_14555 [Aggregatilineales bacterium]|nr:hypothetical protein [Aggregatilineales bacterium]